jgi:hypothetical protein
MNNLPVDVVINGIIPYLCCLDLHRLGMVNKHFESMRRKRMYKKFTTHLKKALSEIDSVFSIKILDDAMHTPDILKVPNPMLRIVESRLFLDIFSGEYYSSSYVNSPDVKIGYCTFSDDIITMANRYTNIHLFLRHQREKDEWHEKVYLSCVYDFASSLMPNPDGLLEYHYRSRKWLFRKEHDIVLNKRARPLLYRLERGLTLSCDSYHKCKFDEVSAGYTENIAPYIQGNILVVPRGITAAI